MSPVQTELMPYMNLNYSCFHGGLVRVIRLLYEFR